VEGSKLVAAAAEAAAGQQYPAPALYVVATPIGNLADLTLRALHVLALVDAIACEDTRHSAALLRHFAIAKPLIAVHEHNERDAAGAVLARLGRGDRVAYVSDAGTPAVSDPGAGLVAAARAAGYRGLIASGTQLGSVFMAMTATHFAKPTVDGRPRLGLGMGFDIRFRAPVYPSEDIDLRWTVTGSEWKESLAGWITRLEGDARSGERLLISGTGTLLLRPPTRKGAP